jgi:hypothetical protein
VAERCWVGGGLVGDAARKRSAPVADGEPWLSGQNVALGFGGRRTIAAQVLRRSAHPHQAWPRRRFSSGGLASERGGGGLHDRYRWRFPGVVVVAVGKGMQRTIAPQGSPVWTYRLGWGIEERKGGIRGWQKAVAKVMATIA